MLHQPIFISCDVHLCNSPDATARSLPTYPTPGIDVGYDRAIHSVVKLRRDARKAGWARIDGVDYCPQCVAFLKGGKQ